MTAARSDPIDDVVVAFLVFLEGEGQRPSLDHLDEAQRTEAESCIRLLEATYSSDPSRCPEIATDPVARHFGYLRPCEDRAPRRRRKRCRRSAWVGAAVFALVGLVVGVADFVIPSNVTPALATTVLQADCPPATAGDKPHIEIAGVWGKEEAKRFRQVLTAFVRQTGISVTFANGSDLAGRPNRGLTDTLRSRIDEGCPPDVALLPQPGLLRSLAQEGALRPLDGPTRSAVELNYTPAWQALAEVGGVPYGVWFKAAAKSIIWYNPAVFKQAGVGSPPTTWEGLDQVAAKLSARGVTPFSLGGADGWTLTDWFEVILARSADPDVYQRLARHDLPWTDAAVRDALSRMAELLLVPGRTRGANDQTYEQSVDRVFAPGVSPKAAMVLAGDYAATEIATSGARPGEDARFFEVPSITSAGEAPQSDPLVGGDVAVGLTDNPGGAQLLRYLAEPEAAAPWMAAGGFLSPNRNADLSLYRDPGTRQLAAEISTSETLMFDLSDLQPPAFGAVEHQGMWQIFQDFVGQGLPLNEVMQRLQEGARRSWEARAG